MTVPPLQFDTSVNGLASLVGVFLFLTTASIVGRFVARYKQKVHYGVDDWLMIPTWLWFVGISIASIYSMANHFAGIYAPTDKKALLAIHPTMLKTYFSIDLLAILTYGFVKLSILFFYRRIFCVGGRGAFNIVTWVAIGVVAAWTFTFFVFTFELCGSSINNIWGTANTAVCLTFPYYMATTISDFLLDVFILCMPIPKIWALHTTNQKKLAVTGVFLFALAGLGASTARMVITIHLVTVGKAVDDEDSFQSNTQWQYFIILECGLTIVAANLPTLWYFGRGVTPQGVLRSVRSLVSLGSSNKSKHSKTDLSKDVKNADGSSLSPSSREASMESRVNHSANLNGTSYQSFAYPEGNNFESVAMRDVPQELNGQGIKVSRTFEHSEQRV